mmetsp:Transcript_55858/g.120793  ORF Transcript_55858/g.120793 Transcript_55858/m.120793 type:complete len:245 (-) Transcript_55858:1473-2207(-)
MYPSACRPREEYESCAHRRCLCSHYHNRLHYRMEQDIRGYRCKVHGECTSLLQRGATHRTLLCVSLCCSDAPSHDFCRGAHADSIRAHHHVVRRLLRGLQRGPHDFRLHGAIPLLHEDHVCVNLLQPGWLHYHSPVSGYLADLWEHDVCRRAFRERDGLRHHTQDGVSHQEIREGQAAEDFSALHDLYDSRIGLLICLGWLSLPALRSHCSLHHGDQRLCIAACLSLPLLLLETRLDQERLCVR